MRVFQQPVKTSPFNHLRLQCFALLLLALAAANNLPAQGYIANATLNAHDNGNGTFQYTILLNNDGASMSPIGTFWFAWVPDAYSYDLLPSLPTDVITPSGWSGYAAMGYGSYYYADGYSIEFTANGQGLQPGHSLTFGFTSTDSPDTIEATSPYDNLTASTSYIYSSYAYYDAGAELSVPLGVVPEPSTLSLLAVGAGCLALTTQRFTNRVKR